MTDDAQLLREYLATRSNVAFAQLVERHLGMVYYSALRQLGGDSGQAQDVAQSVFILLANKAVILCRHPTLAGWLHVTTHRKVSELIRAERRRRAREQQAYLMPDRPSHSSIEADWEQIRPALDEVILKLNETDRDALLLRYFEGQPFGEIGARLLLTEAAAQKKVARAVEKLRASLARRGITSSAGALAMILDARAAATAPPAMAAAITAAVAKASIATVSLRVLLELMSMSKTTVVAVTSAIIIAGGIATMEIRAGRVAAASLAVANRQRDSLTAQLQDLELRSRQAERDRTAAGRTIANLRAARTADPDTAVDAQAAGEAFAAAHPDVKSALVARSRARTLTLYGALFQALGLSSDQVRQFEDVRMQREKLSLGSLKFNIGTTWSTDDQIDDELHSILGNNAFQQYQAYQQMMPTNQLMTDLAGAMSFTATPLTTSQAAQLRQTVIDNPSATPAIESSLFEGSVGGIPWQTLLAKAPAILSAAQLPFLTNAYQQALYREAAEAAVQSGQP